LRNGYLVFAYKSIELHTTIDNTYLSPKLQRCLQQLIACFSRALLATGLGFKVVFINLV